MIGSGYQYQVESAANSSDVTSIISGVTSGYAAGGTAGNNVEMQPMVADASAPSAPSAPPGYDADANIGSLPGQDEAPPADAFWGYINTKFCISQIIIYRLTLFIIIYEIFLFTVGGVLCFIWRW